jgi:transcriptional regulator of NAD metabolism
VSYLEIITLIREIIISIAAIVGACTAYLGLKEWKHQLKGTTRYEVAKNVIRSSFELRDEIKRTRGRLVSSAEMSHVLEDGDDLVPDKLSHRAYIKRLEKLDEIKRRLEMSKIEVEAVFGKDNVHEIATLISRVHEMYQAFNFVWEMSDASKIDQTTRDLVNEDRKKLYGNEDDEFGSGVVSLVNQIEKRFRVYLD